VFFAKVYVTLKPTVNDPQGLTIRGGLHSLGFDEVKSVRAGKYIEVQVDLEDEAVAEQRITEMCQKLLANGVIEDFRFELESRAIVT
jgi:phosphoribosylformylglycinamidine synthase subunit PurS